MLSLHIDGPRLRKHLAATASDFGGLVPVAKGNGYGFGIARLAAYTAELGLDTIAVGTANELAALAGGPQFANVVVLTPLLPGEPVPGDERVVHTAASQAVLPDLTGRRVVVECRTSLRRHGVVPGELTTMTEALAACRFEGFALHLPLDRPDGVDPVAEVDVWVQAVAAASLPTATFWVSHLSAPEVAELTKRHPGTSFRSRIGTRLWLGDRGALRARAKVLDVELLERGDRFGYRQHRAKAAGRVVVVAGGTAHGIGLSAPRSVAGLVPRAKTVAEAGLAGVNLALSPFSWAGKQRWFAEPPHMQVSLLWLPAKVDPPAVGDHLDVETRMTTTTFDAVIEE
ncbi:MAG TPA: alanine racemase [Sporichthyaceae bacterium]|jgi:hypothetical protein|nr:alanine racemase [Sporichthyaceae bacterium]